MDAAPLQVTVPEEAAGTRADRFLAEALAARLPGLTRSRLKAMIEEGRVTLGGATLEEPSRRVKPGQVFELRPGDPTPAEPEGQAMDLVVAYEDADLIVIDKPAGLVVHPAPGNPDRTLVNALIAHCGPSLRGVGGVQRPGIVHRLDKDTSGLIVAAKHDLAHQGLARQFADRSIERRYLALVWGLPSPVAGVIEGNIGRDPRNRQRMAIVGAGKQGFAAESLGFEHPVSKKRLPQLCLPEIRKFPMLEPANEEYMLAKRWREHEATARRRTAGDQPSAPRRQDRHGLSRLWPADLRTDLRGQCRHDAGGQALRSRPRLPPGDLCHVVDPRRDPGIHPAFSWSLVKMGTTAAQKKLFFNLRKLKGQMQAPSRRAT
jgi:RluA family pseudouridine synthase